MDEIMQDFADALAEIIPDEEANGEAVKKLTDRQPEPFYLLAGGAMYLLDREGFENINTQLDTLIVGNNRPEKGDTARFRRDDPEDKVGFSMVLNDVNGNYFQTNVALGKEDLDAEQTGPFKSHSNAGKTFSVVEPGEVILGLEYATFGSWSEGQEGSGKSKGGFFFSGVPTKETGMPKSGSASYAGLTIGTVFDADYNQSALAGDMALAVNFADGSVDGDFTNMMQTSDDGTASAWRDFTMAASINAGTDNFSGTTSTNDGLLSGQAEGAFFGPGAAEVAGAWTLSGDGETALGSFAGGKN